MERRELLKKGNFYPMITGGKMREANRTAGVVIGPEKWGLLFERLLGTEQMNAAQKVVLVAAVAGDLALSAALATPELAKATIRCCLVQALVLPPAPTVNFVTKYARLQLLREEIVRQHPA
jgi:hypothetical protein